jgi:hypothetical protein
LGKFDVVILATPLTKFVLPSEVVPFQNVTFRFAVGPAALTVAVNVTGWPYVEGLGSEVSTVVAPYCSTTGR